MLLFDLLAQGSSQGQGNWWEPGTENFLDVGDLAAILAFLTALVMTTMGVTRWWLRQLKGIIRDEIEKATEPIHPNSNGGYSLPDVAKRQRILEKKVNDLGHDMVETKDLLLQIAVNTQNQQFVVPERLHLQQRKHQHLEKRLKLNRQKRLVLNYYYYLTLSFTSTFC